MTLAMLLIPMVDGFAKYLSNTHSPLFISFARYAVASLIVLPLTFIKYGKNIFPKTQHGAHFLRTIFLVSAMTCYFLAIAKIELATAVTAFFISPIIATIIAIVLFGEKLTQRKGISLVLGFCGALIIVQPRTDISPGILLALASGGFFALYMIATRLASQTSDPLKTLSFQCVIGAFLLLPQALWTWSWPTLDDAPFFIALGALSATSHILSITAFRYAETSLLAPLVYVELLGTAAIGYFIFNETPALTLWIGTFAIILSGLLLMRSPQSKTPPKTR